MLANSFLALATFLGINDLELDTTEADVIVTMLALADGRLIEEKLATWIRAHVRPASP